MSISVPLAIACGLLLGGALSYFGTSIVTRSGGGGRPVKWFVAGGVLLAFFPGLFLAFVVGGNIGGGYADLFFGTPIPGIAVGMAVVLAETILAGAILGVSVGRLFYLFSATD